MSNRKSSVNSSANSLGNTKTLRSQSHKEQSSVASVAKGDSQSQTKITDFDMTSTSPSAPASPSTVDPAPATNADIMKVLETLNTMREDNATIKKQLSDIQDTFQTKINEIDSKLSNLSTSTTKSIQENKSDIKNLQHNMTEIEEGLNFQGEQIRNQKLELEKMKKSQEQQNEKLKEFENREANLKKELQNMQDKNLDMERHLRKYNLLMYGIPERSGENIYRVIKTVLKEDLKMQNEQVDNMLFANAHRLPSRGSGPKPIIVRFVRWTDRDSILSQVFTGILPRGKRIMTDLPPILKAERHRLMQEAYQLRNSDNPLKTRVIEIGNSVRLQVRKSVSDSWTNYKK